MPASKTPTAIDAAELTWAANTVKTWALLVNYSVATTGVYLVGFCINAGTRPGLVYTVLGENTSATPLYVGTGTGAYGTHTTTPPNPATLGSEDRFMFWVEALSP